MIKIINTALLFVTVTVTVTYVTGTGTSVITVASFVQSQLLLLRRSEEALRRVAPKRCYEEAL